MTKVESEKYLCPHCNVSFDKEPDEPLRCPKCLRKSGVVPLSIMDDDGPVEVRVARFGGKRMALLTLGVGALIAGVVVLLVQARSCFKAQADKPAVVSGTDEKLLAEAASKDVPADALVVTTDVDEAVAKLAEGMSADGADDVARGEKLLGAFADLHGRGLIQKAPVSDRPPAAAPQTAGALAAKLNAKETVTADAYELASLLFAVAKAKGVSPQLAEKTSAKGSSTSLRRKELGIVVGTGDSARFLDPWNGVADRADAVRALSSAELAAYGMGLLALYDAGQGDKAKAAQDIAYAQRLFPDSAALLFLSGQLEIESGGAEFGIQNMEKAVVSAPDAVGYYNLGVAYARNESSFKAYQSFHKAVELDPAYAPGWLALGNMDIQRLGSTPPDKREELLAGAEESFKKATEADPNVSGLGVSEAQLLLLRDKKDEAKQRLERAIQDDPKEPDPHLMLGQLAFEDEDYGKALDELEKGALLGPERPELRQMLAGAYGATRKWDRAVKTYRELLEAAPEAQDLRPQLATALRESGKGEEAAKVLEEQVAKHPKDTLSKMLLAQLRMDEKRYDDAVTLLDEAVAADPSAEGQILQFLALYRAGKEDRANAVMAKLAASRKDGRLMAAQVLLEQGEVDLAITVLRSELSEHPDNSQAAVMLATALRATGKTDESGAVKAKALESAPEEEREELGKQFDEAFHQIDSMTKEQ